MKAMSKFSTVIIALLFFWAAPSWASASEIKTITPVASSARSVILLNRLQEIKSMNTDQLSRSEKRELRKETKSIKREVKSNNSGIYISTGALIIIILLIILL